MSKKQLFKPHSAEQQKEYEREVRLQYGPDNVNQSVRRWNGYSDAQKQAIGEEGNQVYNDLLDALEAGKSPLDEDVQAIFARWHSHLGYFYEPTLEILRNLGETYNTHPGFIKTFTDIHPDMPQYLQDGITQYVDDLETAEIQRLYSEDDARLRRLS